MDFTMLTYAVLMVALLFVHSGLAQPARCDQTIPLTQRVDDFIVVLGEVNCFSCSQGASWTARNDMSLDIPVSSGNPLRISGIIVVEVENDHALLPDPGAYVLPGAGGQRSIVCRDNMGSPYEAKLSSPELVAPIFNPPIVNEFTRLTINCINTVPNVVGRVQIFNRDGDLVGFLSYTVENVTRDFAGIYSCVVMSQVSNTTKATTAEVIIRYAPEITPANVSSHRVILSAELQLICRYVGVPSPNLQWLHNNSILTSQGGVSILSSQQENTTSSVVIATVNRDSGGTYTCRANNSLGIDEFVYTVLIVVPPAPVSNLMVNGVGEREVSLSWTTGFNGFSLNAAIVVDIVPERGAIAGARRELGFVSRTTINNLLPFRSYDLFVSVVNEAGASDGRTTRASTLSLRLGVPQSVVFISESTTSIVLTWSAPTFDPDTTDDPNYYSITFSRQDSSDIRTQNVSASSPRRVDFAGLMMGTSYQVSIVAFNDAGAGAVAIVQEQTPTNNLQYVGAVTAASVLAAVLVLWIAVSMVIILLLVKSRAKVQGEMESMKHSEMMMSERNIDTSGNIAYATTTKQNLMAINVTTTQGAEDSNVIYDTIETENPTE